jgi:hypothetical protein
MSDRLRAVFLRLVEGIHMTEPVIPSILVTASGVASAVFGFLFDVPGSTVFAAAAGTFLAVRLGSPMPFRQALVMVAIGTFVGAALTSLFISYAGSYPQRGVALLLAFTLIYYRVELLEAIRGMLKGESLRELIKGFRK